LSACVEGGLLAPLAAPLRDEEAAEAAGMPAELSVPHDPGVRILLHTQRRRSRRR
jgi:hypothetical protein